MRLLSAALWAALMASAVVSAKSMAHPKLMAAGILVASTPAALYFAGTVNPSGIEIAASTCAWAAGLALALGDEPVDGRLVTRFGAALAILAATRPLSPLFAAVVVAVVLALAPRPRIRELGRRQDVRRWLAVALSSAALTMLWTALVALPNQVAFRSIGVANAEILARWPLLTLLGMAQVVSFITTGHRYGVGDGNHRPLFSYLAHPSWRPPIQPLGLLMAFVVATAGIILMTTRWPDERFRQGC